MIELYSKAAGLIKVNKSEEITDRYADFLFIQFIDYTRGEIDWARERFGIDMSIMGNAEDIEISSHFYENATQSAFHFSLPYYSKNEMLEESFFLIITADRVFIFTGSGLDTYLGEAYASKFQVRIATLDSVSDLLRFQIEMVADYYADLTENISKKVKALASRLLLKKDFQDNDLDIITELKFNNLLIKESMNEFTKVLTLFRKSMREPELNIKSKIDDELSDLSVVSDYIQFNFDRLDDLKENISNKIDLEQNRIFKILTMVTVCIALPTLITGIYGMNFEVAPGMRWAYSYPVALFIMALSVVIPIVSFRRRRWL